MRDVRKKLDRLIEKDPDKFQNELNDIRKRYVHKLIKSPIIQKKIKAA